MLNDGLLEKADKWFISALLRELEREEKKLEMEIKKAAKMGNKSVQYSTREVSSFTLLVDVDMWTD